MAALNGLTGYAVRLFDFLTIDLFGYKNFHIFINPVMRELFDY